MTREKPKTLYKFRDWKDPHHKKVLTASTLWVPNASRLNDPFDCCIPLRYDLMDDSDMIQRFARIRAAESPGTDWASFCDDAREAAERHGFHDAIRVLGALEKFAEFHRVGNCVLSFATDIDHPLLWSHYARGHAGFCVGFHYEKIAEVLDSFRGRTRIPCRRFWIDYPEVYPVEIPSSDLDDDTDGRCYARLLATKSKIWDYEKEFRIVFSRDDCALGFELEFPQECVSEVILGARVSDEDKRAITREVTQRFPKATLLQAHKKVLSWELEFLPLGFLSGAQSS